MDTTRWGSFLVFFLVSLNWQTIQKLQLWHHTHYIVDVFLIVQVKFDVAHIREVTLHFLAHSVANVCQEVVS